MNKYPKTQQEFVLLFPLYPKSMQRLTFILFVFCTVIFPQRSYSKIAFSEKNPSKFADITLIISVKDQKIGLQIKPKLTITPINGGAAIPTKDVDGQVTAILTKGELYKIVAELEGYKTYERTIDTKIYEDNDANLVLNMEPLPSANLVLKAVDENGEPIEAMFKITLNDRIYSGRTSRTSPTYKVTLTKSDLYQIEVLASTFKSVKENFYAEVGDPSRQYNKTFTLEKPGNKLQILVFADDTEQPIKEAKLTVKSDTETILDKTLSDGQASIESVFGKNYTVTAEYPGYVKQTFNFKGSLQKEYKIILQSETLVSVGAFNKISGKRVAALFKITDTEGKTQEIQGKAEADIKFKPSGKGTYKIEISAKNYKTSQESLVIENLSAGNLNHKFQLESLVEDFIILVRDVDDKQLVSNPIVKVFDENGIEIEVKNNQKTGEILVQLEKSRDYKIKVEATEYQSKTETLQKSANKLIGVNLKKVNQIYVFKAVDALTAQPITASYKLTTPDSPDPLTGVSDVNRQFKAEVLPKKTYLLEISAEGYNTIKESLIFDDSKKESEINRTIEFQKGAYPFNFRVVDATTKKDISDAKLLILNLASSQPVSLQNAKNVFIGNLALNSNYSIEGQADGYEKTTVTINSKELANKKEYEVVLNKSPFEKYKLVVLEEGNNNKVSNPNLRVFDSKNEPIVVTANSNLTEWQTELRNDESYNVEVKADGFLAYRNSLLKNPNDKTITIKITRVPKHEIIFAAVDAYTKKPIVSEFKVSSNGAAVNGVVQAGGSRYKITISEDKNYEFDVTAIGYNAIRDGVRITEVVNGVKTIELKKDSYPFAFKVIDAKNKKPVSNPKLTISESVSNEAVASKYALENNEFQANLIPDKKYSLKVEANGYEPFNDNLDALALISNESFSRQISLTAIKVEEKPVEKPKEREIVATVTDNKKVTPPPVVEKKEPVKSEVPKPVFTQPKKEPEKKAGLLEAPMEITDADFDVKVEVFEKKVIGRRFRLSNLYFEQSSPVIQTKSYAQLDKLVNTMKLNPKLIIEITGHTDNVGDPRQNAYLSEQRAKVVSNYLFNKGIPNERIKYMGKGQEEPIAINDTDDNRAKNRRVEFVLRDDIDEKK